MSDLVVALGLLLVIEGVAYCLIPTQMRDMARRIQAMPDGTLRAVGLVAAVFGVALVWLVRH
ncbi:DUF2065 family protein [Aurantimonas endophytica]|uniref:DUF2065 domain-containing protein n=1 Tax=Aurantimonas endophytica TaxID=1522175 RepID=A0A7W6MNW4_9HYPH|nr:hypothetical protein [Aurantimonas endophytica]MCO6402122.1 DUF2065 family protein [Aurantimonas endophytica]